MFFEDVTNKTRECVKKTLEGVLEWEVEECVEVKRYERSEERKDHRNGYPTRSLATRLGTIEDIRVPRSRIGGVRRRVKVMGTFSSAAASKRTVYALFS